MKKVFSLNFLWNALNLKLKIKSFSKRSLVFERERDDSAKYQTYLTEYKYVNGISVDFFWYEDDPFNKNEICIKFDTPLIAWLLDCWLACQSVFAISMENWNLMRWFLKSNRFQTLHKIDNKRQVLRYGSFNWVATCIYRFFHAKNKKIHEFGSSDRLSIRTFLLSSACN